MAHSSVVGQQSGGSSSSTARVSTESVPNSQGAAGGSGGADKTKARISGPVVARGGAEELKKKLGKWKDAADTTMLQNKTAETKADVVAGLVKSQIRFYFGKSFI